MEKVENVCKLIEAQIKTEQAAQQEKMEEAKRLAHEAARLAARLENVELHCFDIQMLASDVKNIEKLYDEIEASKKRIGMFESFLKD